MIFLSITEPAVPDCETDRDCDISAACRPDNLGVLKCIDVCRDFTCALHSFCIPQNHRGQCKCSPGFQGNPNDRSGCRPLPKDECQSDAQCPETDVCQQIGNRKKCVAVCNTFQCGPGAVCVANNHVAQCQCPPGLFAGDPQNPNEGCTSVSCLINDDCPFDQACNRLDFTCFDVCFDACGENAICLAENHRYNCQCPPGMKANPSAEIECITANVCEPNPCHSSAVCTVSGGSHQCSCPLGMAGDPYTTGCHPKGMCPNGNSDCPLDTVCINGRCGSPCDRACGPNAICNIANRKPICNCPPGFQPNRTPQEGCNRVISQCSNDAQCQGGVCLDGQCKVVCRDNSECAKGERCSNNMCVVPCVSSSQCNNGQACIEGMCLIGCRSNNDCSEDKACLNNKCENPCLRPGVCGPNSRCEIENHLTTCVCNDGFSPDLSSKQGCDRIPTVCATKNDCGPGTTCDFGKCKPICVVDSDCAQGERCTKEKCLKVCFNNGNCLQGEVCIEGSCITGCNTGSDCLQNEVCVGKSCLCAKGYIPGPSGCVDVDECQDNPCHRSASCVNVVGSFKCSCPPGKVGNPFDQEGCVSPSECQTDSQCPRGQSCETNGRGIRKCIDPCASAVCGNNALCKLADRKPVCECAGGFYGDPNDLKIGCVKGECTQNQDCPSNKICDSISFKCIGK